MANVAVARIGVCTPLGRTPAGLWERIAAGHDGFVEVDRFPLPGLPTRLASAFDAEAVAALTREASQPDPALAFAVLAARDALAGLSPDDRRATALVVATSAGAADTHDAYDHAAKEGLLIREHLVHGAFSSFATTLAEALGLSGPRLCLSTACASGGHALGVAADWIRSGPAPRVLVVGSDAVHASLFAGFHAVGALGTERCAPFGLPFGMSLGEGAGAVLLAAEAAEPLAWMLGWGASCDAHHPTAPHPQGEGVARSLRAALADAGIEAAEVGAYNAHGTGTEANDPAEAFAVQEVLGPVPVSATKSQLGHTQGAAGVLEAIVAILGLRAGAIAPALRSRPPRRLGPDDPVSEGCARLAPHDVVISQSAAFGGTNVSVVLASAPRPRPDTPPPALFAHGIGLAGELTQRAPVVRVRRADPLSTRLTEAVGAACADAEAVGGDLAGLVAGVADGPQQSIRRFVDSRDQRGVAHASAAAFARIVCNAPAGVAAATLQLRGPNLTTWSGAGATAVVVAARMLAAHPALGVMIAAGADERGHVTEDRRTLGMLPAEPIEAAAAVVLSREPGFARLAGLATGPAADWRAVAEQARGGREVVRTVVASDDPGAWALDLGWSVDEHLGHAPATSGVLACAIALRWIRDEGASCVLVLTVSRDAGATALCWTAPDGGSP